MSALLLAAVLPAIISFGVIAALRGGAWARHLADHPNPRSLHEHPTPRIGGLGIAAGILPFLVVPASVPLGAIAACALALFVVSLADDYRGLPIEVRLPSHLVAAGIVVLALQQPGSPWPWGWWGAALAVLAIAWAANLYNFMDGADGLAGGMGAIGFAALAAAAWDAAQVPLALACTAIASACAGFLGHNFPPARVFMGDCGSVPLGFLAATLGLLGALDGAWPPWFALLVFSPFVVDATVTLAARIARGEPFWRAHRDHGYQRLALAGWPRRRLALVAWALMAAAAASALAARAGGETQRCAILFVWAAAYAALVPVVVRLTTRKAHAARVETHPTPRSPA